MVKKHWQMLESKMLAAHKKNNIVLLAKLYSQAGEGKGLAGDENGEAFFLTHAQVFALEAGLELADKIRNRLIEMGREE